MKSLGSNAKEGNNAKVSLNKDSKIHIESRKNTNIFKKFYPELANNLVNKEGNKAKVSLNKDGKIQIESRENANMVKLSVFPEECKITKLKRLFKKALKPIPKTTDLFHFYL